ncbi:MAG: nucleotidyltransferase domain-containing protein [Lachnospiraceae bacterium]|nr:nucleotidyltransferase domain-containing protein [Lachnospiraceae bacterium]
MCYTVSEIREKAVPIAKEYGIRQMSLFGSYARGDANDESDVDIYIDKGQLRSLIRYFMFVSDLEKALQCHVDVVTTGIEDRDFLDRIKSEGVLLYEE